MKRSKRMLAVMLTSFGILALLTFLTFSSYGQNTTTVDWPDNPEQQSEEPVVSEGTDFTVQMTEERETPTSIISDYLTDAWQGFHNGSKTYITFEEGGTVVIRSAVFSNSNANPNQPQYTYMYYEVDVESSPYKLVLFDRDHNIKGVFRIINDDQIRAAFNFKGDIQPDEIDDKFTVIDLYRVEKEY